MYFPSVMMPITVSVRTVLQPKDGVGTCIVARDTFDRDDTIDKIMDFILKTTPDNRVIQEMKIVPPAVL